MDAARGGMPEPHTCILPFPNLTLIVVVFCRCWNNADAFSLLYEPPYTEPYVRWCGRTAEVTPPPTRSRDTRGNTKGGHGGPPLQSSKHDHLLFSILVASTSFIAHTATRFGAAGSLMSLISTVVFPVMRAEPSLDHPLPMST